MGEAVTTSATHTDAVPSIAVSVRGVSMAYPSVVAVDDVSFDLAKGSFLTILGPSGSGKTTLLQMIAGFQAPTSGEIVIAGRPVQAVPPYERSIGMVFQRLALFPHLTVDENVAFPLRMRRFDARTIPERVERYLELVRLSGLGRRRIQQLSGGQQQRVAIARALVFEPDLLLLDEPLASLDRKLREEMQLEFRRIQRELGVTTINVTHDQREALIMSDEVIVMDRGRIQQMDRPQRTYRHPTNRFVAGFIGLTAFLPVEVRSVRDGIARLRVGTTEMQGTVAGDRAALSSEGPADAALRAEQVRIATTAADLRCLDTVLQGRVEDVIFEGERIVYEVQVDGFEQHRVRAFDHDPALHAEYPVGARVFLGWNVRDLLVFGRN
jgi:putative spermidine/putrescine transport system ATP-binding protein